ncbi:butyrophilin subfamily 1 member A1-like [Mastacembelus armatus]|uniref:butyrophilin subfamily 1 member A1-like n=1 Tax=Mastacembelus armatus TaxID=205130 RepID=UPI000E4614BE|nr:butyrophilin subfamily 1 member A1-like [Mastacembelus armatus]
MVPVKDRLSPNCQFTVFSLVSIVLALVHSRGAQSHVIGPSEPIVAVVGDDVILPCYLDPAMDASYMTVEWSRPDLDPRFIFVWRDGEELESKKHPAYQGRTSLFIDELKHGDLSLKLSKVKPSDKGTYRCFVPQLFNDSLIQLVVGAVSTPAIQQLNAGVLECESKGWYPEPEVLWLDSEGNLLSAGPMETLRGPDDLYTVSSRLTVEKRHGNSFTCRVQQNRINQTRLTHIQFSDDFFMVPSTSSTSALYIGFVVGAFLFLLVCFAVVFLVWRLRQNKSKNKRKSPEDGAEKTMEEEMKTNADNTELQAVDEGEEKLLLLSGREEENNVDSGGEKKIKCQGEHKDPHVSERETHQDQELTGRPVKAEGNNKPVQEDSGLPEATEGPTEQLMSESKVKSDVDERREDKDQIFKL